MMRRMAKRVTRRLNPARTVVAKIGGIPAVCEVVGVDRTTVIKWMSPRSVGGTGGVIPAERARRLYQYARKHQLDLTAEEVLIGPRKGSTK